MEGASGPRASSTRAAPSTSPCLWPNSHGRRHRIALFLFLCPPVVTLCFAMPILHNSPMGLTTERAPIWGSRLLRGQATFPCMLLLRKGRLPALRGAQVAWDVVACDPALG